MSASRRYCLTLDLKDDPALIAEYKRYHADVWPEVKKSLHDTGVDDMEIYLLGNRMFMIIQVDETFSFLRKADMDNNSPKVQEWESIMWKLQKPLKEARPGEKWLLMELVFKLQS